MEMGSDSVNDSRGSSTDSSLAGGLKFGQKVYFEDASFGGGAGNGGLMATGAFSSSSSSTGSGRRGRGSGFGQSSQPPRCQVEGCGVDLSNAKAYYSRHKVCGTHSKTPMVIVGGLEQRFCQQCSRFHRLPEFDQGKRSCRRRLAGHNERRRKPQPGSLLASPYARLSSPIFGTPGVGGSFVMDPMAWPAARSSGHMTGNHMRRSLLTPWQMGSENPQLGIYQQGSMAGGMSLPCPYTPGITSPGAESFKGVAECALSLLSNQQQQQQQQSSSAWWSLPRASSSFNLMGTEGVSLAQTTQVSTHHRQNPLWGFKGNDGSVDSHNIAPVLGLAQISEPTISGIAAGEGGGGGFDMSCHRRRYLQPEDSRAYGSSSSQHHK